MVFVSGNIFGVNNEIIVFIFEVGNKNYLWNVFLLSGKYMINNVKWFI